MLRTNAPYNICYRLRRLVNHPLMYKNIEGTMYHLYKYNKYDCCATPGVVDDVLFTHALLLFDCNNIVTDYINTNIYRYIIYIQL